MAPETDPWCSTCSSWVSLRIAPGSVPVNITRSCQGAFGPPRHVDDVVGYSGWGPPVVFLVGLVGLGSADRAQSAPGDCSSGMAGLWSD